MGRKSYAMPTGTRMIVDVAILPSVQFYRMNVKRKTENVLTRSHAQTDTYLRRNYVMPTEMRMIVDVAILQNVQFYRMDVKIKTENVLIRRHAQTETYLRRSYVMQMVTRMIVDVAIQSQCAKRIQVNVKIKTVNVP